MTEQMRLAVIAAAAAVSVDQLHSVIDLPVRAQFGIAIGDGYSVTLRDIDHFHG
ncbi:hypothetical protein D3C81_2302290 [compost metagenome]